MIITSSEKKLYITLGMGIIILAVLIIFKEPPMPDEALWDRDSISQQNVHIYLQMKGVNEKLSQVIYLLQYQDSLMTEQGTGKVSFRTQQKADSIHLPIIWKNKEGYVIGYGDEPNKK